MPTPPTIGQQAIDLFRKYGSKANVARELLARGYSVSEISKAVPMAYSQVHSIQKQRLENANTRPQRAAPAARQGASPATSAPQSRPAPARASSRPERPNRQPQRAQAAAPTPRAALRVGKLRTPGAPSDVEVGECANCGFDLVVRRAPISGLGTRLILVHVNITSDEYINTVQFCQGVPKRLLA